MFNINSIHSKNLYNTRETLWMNRQMERLYEYSNKSHAAQQWRGDNGLFCFYRIAFLSVLPAVKPGALRAASVIACPVFGFRPTRCCLLRTLNVPNPVSTTFSPLFNESRIVFNVVCTASREALFVRLAFFATISMRSFLVKETHPLFV